MGLRAAKNKVGDLIGTDDRDSIFMRGPARTGAAFCNIKGVNQSI
jgi:hypothetical protein